MTTLRKQGFAGDRIFWGGAIVLGMEQSGPYPLGDSEDVAIQNLKEHGAVKSVCVV